jgi:hypothetical protein
MAKQDDVFEYFPQVKTSVQFDSFPPPLDLDTANQILRRVHPQLSTQLKNHQAGDRRQENHETYMGARKLTDPDNPPEEVRCALCGQEIVRREAETFGKKAVGPGDSIGKIHHTCAAGHCVTFFFLTENRTTTVYADASRPESQQRWGSAQIQPNRDGSDWVTVPLPPSAFRQAARKKVLCATVGGGL